MIHSKLIKKQQGGFKKMSEFILFPSETMEEKLRKVEEYQEFLLTLEEAKNMDDLRKMEDLASKTNKEIIFLTDFYLLNDFLKEKFGMNMNDFFEEYTFLYLDEKLPLFQASRRVICLFEEQKTDSNAISELKRKLLNFHESKIDIINYGPLHIHNSDISYFILRKANFNISKNKLPKGFTFSKNRFNFFVSSSSQCDLTVVYEEKDKEP